MKRKNTGSTHGAEFGYLATWRRRWAALAATIAALALAGSTLVVVPASAREAVPDASAVEAALDNAGVIIHGVDTESLNARSSRAESRETRTSATLSAKGLTVRGESASATVTMMPVFNGELEWSPSGTPVFGHTADSAFALTSSEAGNNAGYSVIFGPEAPKEYSYEFTVNGKPAQLEATNDGGVEILDRRGEVVNLIAPPWALDANGADVATEYVISKNVVTQIVRHNATSAFPVVADPRLRCDYLWCTVEATRAETAGIATHAINGGILCSFIPRPGVPACAALVITAWAAASIARSQGKCIGYRVWARNFISWAHLVYIPCYR